MRTQFQEKWKGKLAHKNKICSKFKSTNIGVIQALTLRHHCLDQGCSHLDLQGRQPLLAPPPNPTPTPTLNPSPSRNTVSTEATGNPGDRADLVGQMTRWGLTLFYIQDLTPYVIWVTVCVGGPCSSKSDVPSVLCFHQCVCAQWPSLNNNNLAWIIIT